MKKITALFLVILFTFSLVGCNVSREKRDPVLSENLSKVLNKIYETADFNDEQRKALEHYQTTIIDKSNEESYLGTSQIKYEEGICSAPMMSSIPYELVLLRVNKNSDIEATKKLIKDNANPRKWVCVEAEEVVVENIDNTILFLMANKEEATAVKNSFMSLANIN